MKNLNDLSLRQFTLVSVDDESIADIILDTRDTLADFLSLGSICLYKSIAGADNDEIKVAKVDLAQQDSGMTAYLGNEVHHIVKDSFMDTSCKYWETIANYIAERKCFNNMIIGPFASNAVSMHMIGKEIGVGMLPHFVFMVKDVLPTSWDMSNTIEAQKVVFDFAQKMYLAAVEPFEPEI